MKHSGLVLWNAFDICGMFKTSWRVAGRLTGGVSVELLKSRLFRLVQWLNDIQFLQQTCLGSTNMVRKFYLDCIDRGWNLEG